MISKKSKNPVDENGIYVYIGPSIRGIVQTGSIFRGSREDVELKLSSAIDKYPKIKRLLVKDVDLADARAKIQTSGNGLNTAYNALLSVE